MKISKKSTFLLLGLGFLLIVVASQWMYNEGRVGMSSFQVFESVTPDFNFVFEYPLTNWSLDDSQGRSEKYHAILLRGPINEEKRFRDLIELVVKPTKDAQSSQELQEDFLKRVSVWPKFKEVDKKVIRVGGVEARSLIFEFEERLPMESLQAIPTMLKEQTVFLIKGDKSYRLSLHALSDEWRTQGAVFEHLLKTFKFKD